ncbi:MAG: DUF4199 domain-containing protein [Runella sp.]
MLSFFNKPLLKIPLAFGAMAGVSCFAFFVFIQQLEKFSAQSRTLDIGFFVIFIAAACWYYRKNIGKGYMHIWEGLSIGYVVWISGALVCGYLTYFYFLLSPAALQNYKDITRRSLTVNQEDAIKVWGKELFDEKMTQIAQLEPSSFIFDEFRFTLLLIIIPILLLAVFFRKQKP